MGDDRSGGEPGAQEAPAYDAFISYSHAADGRLAPALQEGLQKIGKPWYRRRTLHVFRDATSLGASPELWPSIERALRRSRTFILLLSPDAAGSPWVENEVRWWRAHRPAQRPFLVLTAGAIEWDDRAGDFSAGSPVPPSLRGWYESEPFWVSLGWAESGQDVSLRNPRFRDCVADLAAPLRSLPKDELIGEDIRQHRRTVRLARSAIALLTVLVLLAVAAAVFAVRQRDQARAQRDVALSRQLAASAEDQQPVDPTLSALLSLTAFQSADTVEARSGLLLQADRRTDVRRIETNVEPATPDGDETWSGRPSFAPDAVTLVRGASDGRVLASGTEDGRVVVWDVDGRRRLATLGGPGEAVFTLGLSPDGRMLASASRNEVALWDLAGQRRLGTLRAGDDVWAIAFSPDGRTLATGSEDRVVTLWDVAGRRRLATLAPPGGPLPPAGDEHYLDLALSWVRALAFSPDGRTLAAGGPDRRVNLWDVARRRVVGRLAGHVGDVSAVAFSPDGRQLVSGGADEAVIIWDVAGRRRVARFFDHNAPIEAVAFSPDGSTVSSAGGQRVIVHETEDRTILPWRHADRVDAVAFSPDGALLASSGLDRGIILWDVDRRRRVGLLVSETRVAGLTKHFGGLPSLAFSPDGRLLVSGTDDGMLVIWDVARRREVAGLPANPPGEFSPVTSVAFSPDGRTLASGTQDGTVALWDAAQRTLLRRLPTQGGQVVRLAFATDGRTVAAAEDDGVASWDVASGRPARTVTLGQRFYEAAFSPDGSTLATTGLGGAVDLWELPSGRRLATLRGHTESVEALAFSPDGRTLATGAGDLTVGLWDVERRREIGYFSAPETPTSVAFSGDGQRLAFGQFDGTVVLRDAGVEAWRRKLCRMVDRELTRDEWAEWVGDLDYREACP